jgi:hypothetical protein
MSVKTPAKPSNLESSGLPGANKVGNRKICIFFAWVSKNMNMLGKRLFASVSILMMGISAPVSAAVIQDQVTVDGVDWTVTILDAATFESQMDLLTAQVWWNNQGLAFAFAETFGSGTSDDFLNSGFGAMFAYDTFSTFDQNNTEISQVRLAPPMGTLTTDFNFPPFLTSDSFRYATATMVSSVPLPAGLPLLLIGFAGLAGLRLRNRRRAQL